LSYVVVCRLRVSFHAIFFFLSFSIIVLLGVAPPLTL